MFSLPKGFDQRQGSRALSTVPLAPMPEVRRYAGCCFARSLALTFVRTAPLPTLLHSRALTYAYVPRDLYDAIEEMEQAMKGMLRPKFKKLFSYYAEVRQVFKIAGGQLRAAMYRTADSAMLGLLKSVAASYSTGPPGIPSSASKDDVKEVAASYMSAA